MGLVKCMDIYTYNLLQKYAQKQYFRVGIESPKKGTKSLPTYRKIREFWFQARPDKEGNTLL